MYTADVHMCSEQFERIRRRLHEQPQFGYTEAAPLELVMAQAIKEDAIWSSPPATLRLAQARSIPAPLAASGKTGLLSEAEAAEPSVPKKKRKKPVRRRRLGSSGTFAKAASTIAATPSSG